MYNIYKPAPVTGTETDEDSGSYPYAPLHCNFKHKRKLGRSGRCYNNMLNTVKDKNEEISKPNESSHTGGILGQTKVMQHPETAMVQDFPSTNSPHSSPPPPPPPSHNSTYSVFRPHNSIHKGLMGHNDVSMNSDSGIGESSRIFSNSKIEQANEDSACKRSLTFKCHDEKPTALQDVINYENIQRNYAMLSQQINKVNFKTVHTYRDKENFDNVLLENQKGNKVNGEEISLNKNSNPIPLSHSLYFDSPQPYDLSQSAKEVETEVSEPSQPTTLSYSQLFDSPHPFDLSQPKTEVRAADEINSSHTIPMQQSQSDSLHSLSPLHKAKEIKLVGEIKSNDAKPMQQSQLDSQHAHHPFQKAKEIKLVGEIKSNDAKPLPGSYFDTNSLLSIQPVKEVKTNNATPLSHLPFPQPHVPSHQVKEVKVDKVQQEPVNPFKQPASVGPAKFLPARSQLSDPARNQFNLLKTTRSCLNTTRSSQHNQQNLQQPHGSNFSMPQSAQFGMNIIYVNTKPYTNLSLLGKGGSSKVYLVQEPQSSQLKAIKCVDLSAVDKVFADGYLNEVELLFKLQGCDRVICMYDHEYVEDQKMLYVVMEMGETDLSKFIRATKNISMYKVIFFWIEMLEAVKDIHEKGIIHSDLKPANFLMVSGQLKLIDFGIASSLQADMTSINMEATSGTINYMSPEAISNSGANGKGYKISYRSDVWSLGCILYNLVYGKTPFAHLQYWPKLQAIADKSHVITFPESVQGRGRVPPVIIDTMRRCLVRDPKQRPTVSELLSYPYFANPYEIQRLLLKEEWQKIAHLFSCDVSGVEPHELERK